MITKDTTLEELVTMVEKELVNVESGEEFTIRELFKGYEWNRLKPSLRTKLGSMIFAKFNNGGLSDIIEPVRKTPQHQQVYVKK